MDQCYLFVALCVLRLSSGLGLKLSKLTISKLKFSTLTLIKRVAFNAQLLTAHTPSAVGPTLNYYLSVFWSGYFCCLRYEKNASKGMSKVTVRVVLEKYQHFRRICWEDEVNILCTTNSIRIDKQGCADFLSLPDHLVGFRELLVLYV